MYRSIPKIMNYLDGVTRQKVEALNCNPWCTEGWQSVGSTPLRPLNPLRPKKSGPIRPKIDIKAPPKKKQKDETAQYKMTLRPPKLS